MTHASCRERIASERLGIRPCEARGGTMTTERKQMADDVQVKNRRLDASENEALIGIARMGAEAFG